MLLGLNINTWIQIVTVGIFCPIVLLIVMNKYQGFIDKIMAENKSREEKSSALYAELQAEKNKQQAEWLDRLGKNELVMQQFLDGLKDVTETQKEIQNTQRDTQTSVLFIKKDVEELKMRV